SKCLGSRFRAQLQPHDLAAPSGNFEVVIGSGFRSGVGLIHRVTVASDYVLVKSVFHIRRRIRHSPQPADVRFILGEQQFWIALIFECPISKLIMRGPNYSLFYLTQERLGYALFPRPGVAKPECRKQVELRRLWAAVVHCDLDQDFFWTRFGVFDKNVKIAI